MTKKIIVLLIIQVSLYSKFDDSLYSFLNRYLFIPLTSKKVYNNINDINRLNCSFSSFSLFDVNKDFNATDIFYKLSNFRYIFNFRFNIIQSEYSILFYYKNQSIITPSELALYFDLHLICHINIVNSNLSIDSLAFIKLNKYFHCIEYVNINEKIRFGIKIYKPKDSTSCINTTQYFFTDNIFNYNKCFYAKNKLFQPFNVKKFKC